MRCSENALSKLGRRRSSCPTGARIIVAEVAAGGRLASTLTALHPDLANGPPRGPEGHSPPVGPSLPALHTRFGAPPLPEAESCRRAPVKPKPLFPPDSVRQREWRQHWRRRRARGQWRLRAQPVRSPVCRRQSQESRSRCGMVAFTILSECDARRSNASWIAPTTRPSSFVR